MRNLFKKIFVPLSIFTIAIGTVISFDGADKNEIKTNAAVGDVVTTWSDNASGYTSGYKSQTATIDGRDWLMTTGQSGYFGANKASTHNDAKITGNALNAAKAVDASWTANTIGMYGVISLAQLPNINKIEFNYTADNGNSAGTEVYLAHSSSLTTTYQLVELQTGVQGSTPGTAKKVTYTFSTISNTYFAILFKTGSYARFSNATIKFYEGPSATGTISVTNSSERLLNGTSLVITPTLGGTGTLTASIGDDTIASLVTTSTSVTVNTLKVGTTDITLSYGGSSVKVALEVYEPVLNFNKTSLKLLPETVGTVTATPIDFSPTSYSWTKVDSNGVIILSNTTSATVTVTATTTLGSATLTVEATDGTTIKQKSLTVTVSEIAEGKYTLSSNATVYTNPMQISQFDVVKSNVELNNIVISDILNTRAFANPYTGHIMIGGDATTGGSFKVTLPEGLFASSIKFSGLQVDSGKTPTLSINSGVSFKYASGMTEAILKSYSNVLTIATSPSRIWVSSIEIEAKTATNAALDFGAYFLATTDAECAASNVQLSTWNKLQSSYSSMDDEVKEVVDSTSINNIGNDLEKAIGRYQVIRTVYGYTGFIGGGSSPLGRSLATKNNEIGLIMIISILGLTSLVGYYFFRKKSLN